MANSNIKSRIFEAKYFGIIIGFIIFFIILLINYTTQLLSDLEKPLQDYNYKLRGYNTGTSLVDGVIKYLPNPDVSRNIILVGIDSTTLDQFGKWPFARAITANLINTFSRITDQNNRECALFLDINFVERDSSFPENDSLLIESIKDNGKVFLESFFQTVEYSPQITKDHGERQKVIFDTCGAISSSVIKGDWTKLQRWKSVEAPLKPYGSVAYRYGGVSTLSDRDEVYRSQHIISRYSILEEEIYLDDLTPAVTVNKANFERLAWIDKNGRIHDIPELSPAVISNLKLQMKKNAPVRTIDIDHDGEIDEEHFIVRKYKDYIIPAMALSLALEYFNKSFDDLEIVIGKYVKIRNPERYDTDTNSWYPIVEQYAKYEYPERFDNEVFNNQVLSKIQTNAERTFVKECFEENKIFNQFILKKDYPQDKLDKMHSILFSINFEGINKISEPRFVEAVTIPIELSGKMLINFMGPRSTIGTGGNRTYTVRPFHGYVSDPGPNETTWKKTKGVEDQLIIVGMFATGLADEKPTPYGLMFGPEVMANALNTIIMQNFLLPVPIWIEIIILLAIILIVALVSTRLKTVFGLIISIVMIVIHFFIVNFAFDSFYLLSFFPAMFSIIFTFISIVVYRVMTEEKEKKKIKSMFGKYVSPTVVETLLLHPPELGGVDKELTVLFSDIRGFTTLSERMTPQALVNHLNMYLTAMTDLILEYKGTLDKYVGDEIMCFWGAPLPQEDHAILACKCALKQMEVLQKLNDGWPPEKRINIGIGINSGIMTVGNMGSSGRMNYTLMGDNVNLGARLEGTNKQYVTNIIISENTYGLVKDRVIVRELDNIRVKGKNKPVVIYELIDIA